ncbi:MAG: hypothetical protein ACR2GP_11185, partial [Burkholderiaceae bacterium]
MELTVCGNHPRAFYEFLITPKRWGFYFPGSGSMGFRNKAIPGALAALFGAGLTLPVAPAAAQQTQTPQRLDRIEVTGSNIKRTDTEGINPVQTITRKEIERTGQATVAELLRSISA